MPYTTGYDKGINEAAHADAWLTPLVSVIVVTYNSAAFVVETLESIKAQTYKAIELIVSDDGSKDDTVPICKKWLQQHAGRFVHTRIVTTPANTGIAGNCNRGVYASQGKWLKLIAGDDALEPQIIEQYIKFTGQNPHISIITANDQAYQNELTAVNALPVQSHASRSFNRPDITAAEQFQILLRHNFVAAPTVMLSRALFNEVGGFDEGIAMLEDWPMWLAVTKAGHKIYFLDVIAAKYRIHASSTNSIVKGSIYKTRVELDIDRIFEKYASELPPAERLARTIIIKRNKVLVKWSGNKRSLWVSLLSKAAGALPVFYLKNKLAAYQ